jgi:hypothetical protein
MIMNGEEKIVAKHAAVTEYLPGGELRIGGELAPEARLAWRSADSTTDLWLLHDDPVLILWRVVARARAGIVQPLVRAFDGLLARAPDRSARVFADASEMRGYDTKYREDMIEWIRRAKVKFAAPLRVLGKDIVVSMGVNIGAMILGRDALSGTSNGGQFVEELNAVRRANTRHASEND